MQRIMCLIILFGKTFGASVDLRKCNTSYLAQPLDHGDSENGFFYEKYYVCDEYFRENGPLFFYTGNESPVELYLNNTGLMWESASQFGALLVFAEHRFYGDSQISDICDMDSMQYFTADQAMQDYVDLIKDIKERYSVSGTITFGGSYGGMLSAYMRMKYPDIVDGAIAASAPIFSLIGLDPAPDSYAFDAVISSAVGEECSTLLKSAYKIVYEMTKSTETMQSLSDSFNTCEQVTESNASAFMDYLMEPWGDLAMGDFPFASNYVTVAEETGDAPMLPPFPLKVACEKVTRGEDRGLGRESSNNTDLLDRLRDGIAVFYNASGTVSCYFNPGTQLPSTPLATTKLSSTQLPSTQLPSTPLATTKLSSLGSVSGHCGSWDFQYCYEFMMAFSYGSDKDFFYPDTPFDYSAAVAKCERKYPGLHVDIAKSVLLYGGYDAVASSSNIYFSNGDLDPWGAWGVDCTLVQCGKDVTSKVIHEGAHHLDLMFASEKDPDSVIEVRKEEREAIARWVEEARVRLSESQLGVNDTVQVLVM